LKVDRRLFLLGQASQSTYILALSCGLAGGALAALQARLLSRIVARVFLAGDALAQVASLLGWLLASVVGRAGLLWGLEVAGEAAAVRIKTCLRGEIFERLLALGPAYTRGERTGELTSLAVEGVEALHAYFSQYLPQLALAALIPLAYLIIILPLDILSGVVLLLTAPLMPVFMILIGSLAEKLTRRQWLTLARMSAYFLDVLQGLTTLKIFGRAHAHARLIASISEQYRQTTMGVLRITFLSALALELLATLSTAIVAVEVGLRLLYGRLGFEQAFFILLLAPEFYQPLRLLGARFHAGMAGVAAAENIFKLLAQPVATPLIPPSPFSPLEGERRAENPQILDNNFYRLAFEGVSYAYAEEEGTLAGVTFAVQRGQRIAVVGRSGAGKSTLASLLLRFIEPVQGRITLNGEDIRRYSSEEWRQAVAWVPQHAYLFNDTVLENIRLARPQASREDVLRAARLAHADGFIERLPDGYETRIGERGTRLSAGQAQRIALARTFLKDAPILLLDEPTSSLDPEHEALVAESLEKLAADRLVLVIAHRLRMVYRADCILVLDQGRLVEQGTHQELLAQGGLYSELVSASVPTKSDSWAYTESEAPCVRSSFDFLPPSPGGRKAGGDGFLNLLRLIAPFGGWIVLAALLGAAMVGSSIGLMSAAAYIIAAAALHPSIATLQVAIVGVRFFGLARGVFRYLERYVSHQVTFKVLARLRVWFYQALEPLAPARLSSFRSGDLLGRAIGDIAVLENFYVRALAPPLVAVIVAVVTLLYMSTFSPALAGPLLVFFVAGGLGVTLLARWLGKSPGEELVQARAAMNASLVDGIQGMADLLAYGMAERQRAALAALDRRYAAAQGRMACLGGLQSALSQLMANLAMWAILTQAIPLVRSGEIAGVYLAVLPLAALTSFEALLPLPLAAQFLQRHLAAARRLFQLVDAEPEVRDPAQPAPPPRRFDLEVSGLHFTYPPEGEQKAEQSVSPALEDVSFSLPQGGRLALVGPSGGGKTTLVRLLLRFWDFKEGGILLGGMDLRGYSQADVRRLVSLVAQDTYLFNATIKENLLIARPDAGEEEIVRAARRAQIHDFIESLPQGYDTWIGEQGLRLSGGERQRLAIARALLKDAPILILDEPTANLDRLTERRLLESLAPAMEGRTTLWITHRLVGLEAMDEILVLDQGRVVERGRHAALKGSGGLYQRMREIQNQL
jgi:ATP-binding cassette subfamily C protein CydCD